MTGEVTNAARIRQLAHEAGDTVAYTHVALDGSEVALTWAALDRRSSQVAGALRERGVVIGDRLAISLRNSPEFVFAVLAAWKLGAVPVPVRWDVPEWELKRLLDVIAARVHVDATSRAWI